MEIMMENESDYGLHIDLLVKSPIHTTIHAPMDWIMVFSTISCSINKTRTLLSMLILWIFFSTTRIPMLFTFTLKGENHTFFNYSTMMMELLLIKLVPLLFLHQLDYFNSTMVILFSWKMATINNSNNIMCVLAREERWIISC
jgi:hypothetical protein